METALNVIITKHLVLVDNVNSLQLLAQYLVPVMLTALSVPITRRPVSMDNAPKNKLVVLLLAQKMQIVPSVLILV